MIQRKEKVGGRNRRNRDAQEVRESKARDRKKGMKETCLREK